LAGQADGVRVAFQRMAPAGMLEDLRKSTRGTVSDLELMQNAVKAGNFGIPLKEMGTLLQFASRRAQETGESVDYLVQSIVTGIGRKSPMILDNLGISTSRLKAEFKGAAIEAQSIADVTAAVAKIAKEEMSKAGTATITAADAAAQVTAQMTNLQVAIGDRLNQSMGPFLSNLGSVVGYFTDLVSIPLSKKYEDEAAAVAGLTVELTSADTAMERRRDIFNYLNSKYPGYLENIDLEKTSMKDLAAATAKLNEQLINRIVIQKQQEKLDEKNQETAKALEAVGKARVKLSQEIGRLKSATGIQIDPLLSLADQAKVAQKAIGELGKQSTHYADIARDVVRASVVLKNRESDLTEAQSESSKVIKEKNELLKQLGITEEKANNLIKEGTAATIQQTGETGASTEAKRKDVDELGRSYDAMNDLKLAVNGLFDTIAKEGTLDEGLEIKTLVGALKDGEKAAKSMNDEIVKAIGTYDLEPLTAQQAEFNEGLDGTVELLEGAINPMFNAFANNMETVNWAVGEFGNILTSSFEAALISGEKFFPTLMTALGNMIKKLIAAAIAAAALAAAITIAFGGNFANIGKLFGGAKNFGQLFGGLFGEMSGIPGLAEGGIVTGPTLAMVGEGRGPEAVIPLDRLHEFTGGGGGVQVYGRIQGADILLSSERADRVRSRYRGF
jgi:hypothetical protein